MKELESADSYMYCRFCALCRTLHICLFDPVNQNVGSCNGDSGGPLVCRFDTAEWDLTGVTSWGTSGCPTTSASVYARVSTFLGFICAETRNEAPGCAAGRY